MPKKFWPVLTVIFIFAFTAPALAGDLLVLVDLSDSPAHVKSAALAARMGDYAAGKIEKMRLGETVRVRTFGQAGSAGNWLALDFRLSRRAGGTPKEVAAAVKLVLANLPKLVAQKKLALQHRTQIIRSLHDLSGTVLRPGSSLLLLSDLMEFSPDADCARLLKNKHPQLPPPPSGFLKGVEIIALGAGHGLATVAQSRRLEAMWRAWFKRAGAAGFHYLPKL